MQRHPFDPRHSGRDAFPCFDTAMLLPLDASDDDSDSDAARDGVRDGDAAGGCCPCDGTYDGCTCNAPAPPASLDWSIDGLATLLPRAFSPLLAQTHAFPHTTVHRVRRRRRWSTGTTTSITTTVSSRRALLVEETPPRSATFFDNEDEFRVLRTPAELIERERAHARERRIPALATAMGAREYATWRASPESAARWRDLHRRCVDTIQLCEARLRERQQRLARLPFPATKLKLQRRSPSFDNAMCSSRSDNARAGAGSSSSSSLRIPRAPLTPVKPTRLSFGSIDLSPIPLDGSQQTALHLQSADPKTPTSTAGGTPVTNRSAFSSPALSSIAEYAPDVLTPSFASLQFSASREEEDDDEDEKENKASASQDAASACSSASSLKTLSLLRGPGSAGLSSASASSSPPSFTSSSVASPPQPPHSVDAREEADSIALRQQSFVAAIEEEAEARDAATNQRGVIPTARGPNDRATAASESDTLPPPQASTRTTTPSTTKASPSPSPSPSPSLYCSPPATSMASIYKEARALGLTEPTAQWEYVQLIRRQTQRTTRTAATAAGAAAGAAAAPTSRASF